MQVLKNGRWLMTFAVMLFLGGRSSGMRYLLSGKGP